jgi:hypothetical protein
MMTNEQLSNDELRLAFLEILTYLATSARGTIYEPRLYGPLRLMEAANRVIHLMGHMGLSNTDLDALARQIVDEAMIISTNETRCIEFTDQASLIFARALRDA